MKVLEPKPLKDPAVPEKAFMTRRVPGGWVFAELTIDLDAGEILDWHQSQPDVRPVAEERFKIAVGKQWADMANKGIIS